MALLELRGISKRFGGLIVLDGLELVVQRGEILGLVGPNGAGKSTLLSLITGFQRPTRGQIIFDGRRITGLQPDQIAKRGVVRSFQEMTLWGGFTVLDTMRAALQMKSSIGFWEDILQTPGAKMKERQVQVTALDLLRFVGMDDRRDQLASTLSHGYQRTLSLAMVLATSPILLLLDEPLTALNHERADNIIRLIQRIRDSGTTILIVEHNMTAIFSLCDRIVVLNSGKLIADGTPQAIRNDQAVIEAYLGN